MEGGDAGAGNGSLGEESTWDERQQGEDMLEAARRILFFLFTTLLVRFLIHE